MPLMHHIQRKILSRLMHAQTLGYAQMRPERVESNHFAYHLDQLLREGLVAKQDRSYALTPKGLALADRVSHQNMTLRTQPHIVTSIYITNEAGEQLMYQHLFQPYLDLYGPPQGRLHYDEHITEAAARELTEKTGLTGIPLSHRGMVYIHATRADETVSKILAHIFTGTAQGRPPLADPSEQGICSWIRPDEIAPVDCMPGFSEVRDLLSAPDNGLFFAEVETAMA